MLAVQLAIPIRHASFDLLDGIQLGAFSGVESLAALAGQGMATKARFGRVEEIAHEGTVN